MAAVLLMAAACADGDGAADHLLSAAGSSGQVAPAPVAPTTAAPAPTPATTAPSTTTTAATATTKRPAPTTTIASTAPRTRTTRVPVTPSPPIAGYSPAPPPPGVAPDGYGGYGGVTEAATGPVTLELSVYPREQYLGEHVQVFARVSHPLDVGITSLKIDYGNGHVVTSAVANSWFCNTAQDATAGSGNYVYPAPGNFRITATATFVTCMGVPGAYVGAPLPPPPGLPVPWFPEPHEVVAAGIDVLARPDRPPRPIGPSPGA